MKKIASILAAAAMFLTLTACSSSDSSTANDTEAENTSAKSTAEAPASDNAADTETESTFRIEKLRVGSDVAYPPFEYYDADGVTPIGVDMELAEALGEKLGCEVEIVNTAWDGIFAGLAKGDYDVVISAVTITADRLIDFDFSDPYIENWQAIVVMSDGEVKPADPSELAGLRVGYQEDTTSDIYLTEYIDKNGITVDTYEYATVMNAYDDLAAGRLDAVISDSTVAAKYIADEKYEQSWIQTEGEPELFGICMPKGSADLQAAVNGALAEIKADGTLDKIFNTYF